MPEKARAAVNIGICFPLVKIEVFGYCQKFYENQRGMYETTEDTEECSVFSTDLIVRTFLIEI
jgi:hypothetical protein